jgi:hypothetical protein
MGYVGFAHPKTHIATDMDQKIAIYLLALVNPIIDPPNLGASVPTAQTAYQSSVS